MILRFFLVWLLGFCLTIPVVAIESLPDKKPNILFIAVDDLRPELGCYGTQQIRSPNINRLASTGLLFSRAYCQQAVCNPSRTSLMTGLRPNTIGVTGNHIHFRSNKPDVVTLPQHFINHGYHARAIGKLYHGVFHSGASITKWDTMGDPQSWSAPAIRFGPRYYYTEKGIAAAKETYQQVYKPKNPGPDDWTTKLVFGPATESPDVSDNTLYDGQVADAAIDALGQLKQHPNQPFFLAVGFIKPHSPYIAPKKYFDLYDAVDVAQNQELPQDTPAFAGHGSGELRRYTDQPNQGPIPEDKQRRIRQAYYACVSYVDAQIGRVLDELDRLGLAENTIVSLYGDHGYHLGEQGLWGKTTNFELDTRVPLVVRAPGMKAAGKSSSSLVELLDLYPTLTELAGLPLPEHLEGKSFSELLDNPSQQTKTAALSQYPRSGGLMGYSIRTDTHRLTQWIHTKTGKIRATELYDYSYGNIEKKNLAAQAEYKSQLERLSRQLFTSFGLSPVTTPARIPAKKKTKIACVGDSITFGFNGENGTSFEDSKAGVFKTIKTKVGTWTTTTGTALIDNKHAKSGNQCLQLAGGDKSVVELEIAERIKTDGQLSFWAERWTRRDPFSFRIEKHSGDKWTEIFDGDNQVKVGRAFLSSVVVSLGDPGIRRLRFSVSSPPDTGILIDDFKFASAQPQRVTNVEVVPMTLPALVDAKASALLKIRIDTAGGLDPIALTELTATLADTTDSNDVASVQVYFTGANRDFQTGSLFCNSKTPASRMLFKGYQTLSEGSNYFWVACTLDKNANIDHRVGAACSPIKFSNGKQVLLKNKPSIQRLGVAVRKGGDGGVHTYRIPGLATTNKGTLIGVYDIRRRGGGDLPGDIDVGMSRSTNGGRTWEPMKVIMDMGDDPKFNHDGIGDPSVLVDRQTGTIWVAATWSHGNRSWRGSQPGLEPADTGQLILVRSDNDGLTWSEPINITKQVKKNEWCFLLQGPGKGITLSDGTLIFAAQYQDPPNKQNHQAHRLPHSTFIYSRDHGDHWEIATGAYDDTTESQVVELNDGQIMINCRFNRETKRVVMTTDDLGQSWNEHLSNRIALDEPGSCMASLINVGRELGKDKTDWLLFSNPNSTERRDHMTIKASSDLGKTWPERYWLLLDEQRGAGYSCMSMIDEGTVGILYEGSQAQMTFQRIKLKDIIAKPKTDPHSLSIGRVFGDHMVLQSNQPIRVWGGSKPRETVSVSLGATKVTASANSHGKWMAELPAHEYCSTPVKLTAIAGDQSVTINDVLIGEVWFCAGQSNMELPVSKSADARRAIEDSNDQQLRLLNFAGAARGGSGVYGPELLTRLTPDQFGQGSWMVSGAESVGMFSAVGYYFAERLRKELDCPVGIINVSIGGTPIESWISKSTLCTDALLSRMLNGNWLDNPVLDDWCKKRARSNLQRGLSGELNLLGDRHGPNHSFKPGFMYQAAVAPFAPMSIQGVLWYQGESNADNRDRIMQYHAAFPLLVRGWRDSFQNHSMPLAFVQLPAMGRPNWPLFREYQRRSLESLENVGMAITIDTGHPTNVHPKTKKLVGERLAQWALVDVYDKPGPAMGPLYKSKSVDGNRLVLIFESVGDELRTTNGKAPTNFELAGVDGEFHAATAQIDGKKIILNSQYVAYPRHARYAWSPVPNSRVNLVNSDGLPASPFTTEDEF